MIKPDIFQAVEQSANLPVEFTHDTGEVRPGVFTNGIFGRYPGGVWIVEPEIHKTGSIPVSSEKVESFIDKES